MKAMKTKRDDNDHMALGDYGNEYGEYRWGVFMRFIQRMLRHPGGKADKYFSAQQAFFEMHDTAGAYLKDGAMRAHIDLCPRECVVFQVQEFVEGLALEQLAWVYRDKFAPGHNRMEGLSAKEEKGLIRGTVAKWMMGAGLVLPSNDTSAQVSALTELVVARVLTTFLHFHAKCGIVHDDMHVGNIILTAEHGDVKIIDWELAKVISTSSVELASFWRKDRGNKGALLEDRGTQCDSLFPKCVCEWPYQVVGRQGTVACNLFGLKTQKSRHVLQLLAQRMVSLGTAFLGERAAIVRELVPGRSEL